MIFVNEKVEKYLPKQRGNIKINNLQIVNRKVTRRTYNENS